MWPISVMIEPHLGNNILRRLLWNWSGNWRASGITEALVIFSCLVYIEREQSLYSNITVTRAVPYDLMIVEDDELESNPDRNNQ